MKKFYFFLIAIALGGLAACSEPEYLAPIKPSTPRKPGTGVNSGAHRAPQKENAVPKNQKKVKNTPYIITYEN